MNAQNNQLVRHTTLTHTYITEGQRKMHAMWLYLRENMRCGNKVSDVIGRPERCRNKMMSFSATASATNIAMMKKKKKKKKLESSDDDEQLVHLPSAAIQLCFREHYIPTWLCELDDEDISRKVVEMIVQKASKDPSKPISSKIKRVFRVHYPKQMVERFENYREKVKKMAYDRNTGHHHHHHQCPRNTVDGNEVLRFYGTTIACCSSKRGGSSSCGQLMVRDLCRDSRCRVCIILRTNFQTENTLKSGIQLSRCSEVLSENHTISNTRTTSGKYNIIRRAVIVCRTIAGIVVNMIGEELINFESYSSLVHPPHHHNNSEYLLVPNPSALLPCFVVVLSS